MSENVTQTASSLADDDPSRETLPPHVSRPQKILRECESGWESP
jgi:hypothetical protein